MGGIFGCDRRFASEKARIPTGLDRTTWALRHWTLVIRAWRAAFPCFLAAISRYIPARCALARLN